MTRAGVPAGDPRHPASSPDVAGSQRWRAITHRARAPLGSPAARRSAWILVDQAVSSLSNFTAAVLVARATTESMFGAFTVAFLVYTFVVSVSRGLVSQPLAIRVSARRDQGDEVAAAAGAAVVSGAVAAVVVSVAGLLAGGAVGDALLVTGVLLPPLVLQDTWRYVLFTTGRPARAAVNDLVWLGAQIVLIVLVVRLTSGSVALLTGAWAGGAVVAAVVGVGQAGVVPALRRAIGYVRRHLALGWRLAGEVVVGNGSFQVTMLAIGAVLGTAGVGAVRGGAVLFGPLNIAIFALGTGGIAEGSRLLARSPHRLLPVLAAVSGALVVVSVAWGAVLVVVPDALGREVLGDTWSSARELVIAYAAVAAGMGVAASAQLALRIVAAASEVLRLAVVMAGVIFVGAAAGALAGGAPGAVWGFAVGAWAKAAGGWWLVRRYRRQHPLVFAGAADASTGVETDVVVRPGSGPASPDPTGDDGQVGDGRLGSEHWRRVPLTPRRVDLAVTGHGPAAFHALRIYQPIRRSSRLYVRTVSGLTAGGVCRRVPPPLPDVSELARDLGIRASAIAARRSTTAGRWLLSFSDRDGMTAVAKLGSGDDARLRNEANMLRSLQGRRLGISVPAVVASGDWRDRFVLVSRPLDPSARPTLDLVEAERAARTLMSPPDDGPPVVHGDLTPWNLWRHRSRLTVIDWEHASPRFAPLWDLSMFVTLTGAYVGTWSPRRAVDLLTADGGIGAAHVEALGLRQGSAAEYLLAFIDDRHELLSQSALDFIEQMRCYL